MDEKKYNVLYVDDEPDNLTAFSATFRRYYNIYTATSARQGIEIMRKTPIHVVITDQRMPEMTGVQFLEAIMPEYPQMVRMILTGFTDVEAIIKAINSGRVYHYITKPWDFNELKITIDSGLRYYELEIEKAQLIQKLQEEIKKQQHIVEMFGRYVPQQIVEDILNSENHEPIIHGEYRIISSMFADLHQFTTISEKIGPEKTMELLNEYYTLMSLQVRQHQGSINRLMGDGVLALFGAPISSLNNELNAVKCGLDMLEALKELDEKFRGMAGQSLDLGIGIHTGEVIVGNVGAIDHIEYTAIGDTVNLAERVQELTHNYPNSLLITESTYKLIQDQIQIEELGPQKIRGRAQAPLVYKVIAIKNQ